MSRLDRTVATMTGAGAATPAKELVSLADTTISTGLIERSAAAFASGMQEGAGDDGFFGPASVTWRMSADLVMPCSSGSPACSRRGSGSPSERGRDGQHEAQGSGRPRRIHDRRTAPEGSV